MDTVIKHKPIKSAEINFKSEKEYDDFVKMLNNPPEPNERVKKLMKQYQSWKDNSGWKK
ncbi:DUF1778 domain-containing protein [Lentibacillus sp. L22]|uniref:type II toxin-antitoxin system TacA family antitoxin n=1 Tax=Lentibacillus TaxID=175304 RepID=UPI0022B1DFAD|nr:DUF1778 domain-containing protein [Lentibacillus daqui]